MPYYRFYIFLFILQLFRPLEGQAYLRPELIAFGNAFPSKEISGLALDETGFLWVSTTNDLYRYDGYHIVQFPLINKGQRLPADQEIKSLRHDASGNIWLLTSGAVIKINRHKGSIDYNALFESENPMPPGYKPVDFFPSRKNELWVLSDSLLISVHAGQPVRYFAIPHPNTHDDFAATCLAADYNGNLWIGTTSGILFFERQNGTFTDFMQQNSQGLLTNQRVNTLFLDSRNFLWIGTDNGLNRFDQVDYDFDGYFPGGKSNNSGVNKINAVGQSTEGTLVVSTSSGLFSFDEGTGIFSRITDVEEHGIKTIAVDQYGSIWGGTSEGIVKIRRSRLSIHPVQTTGLLPVTFLAKGPGDGIIVSYSDYSYDVMNTSNAQRRNYKTLDGTQVSGIYPFNHQYLILSKHEIEMADISGPSHIPLSARYPFVKKDLLRGSNLNCLLAMEHEIWIGTSAGLQVIRLDSSLHVAIPVLRSGNQSTELGPVYDIASDEKHVLYLATTHGLVAYDPGNGSFYTLTPYDKVLYNTEHKQVYRIIPGTPGMFWIGTSLGAYRFDVQTQKFTDAFGDLSLLRIPFRTMTLDAGGNLWALAGKALHVLNIKNNTHLFFDQRDGIQAASATALCTGSNNRIFTGGNQGLTEINGNAASLPPLHFKAVVSSVRYIESDIHNENILYFTGDSAILPWKRLPIQIELASASLSQPEESKYRYSLVKSGNKPVWHNLGSRNTIITDHLQPGDYQLQVAGLNSLNPGNSDITHFTVVIQAPPLRSRTAVIIYLVIGVVLIILVLRLITLRFFKLSRENQEREMFARQIMLQKEELTLKNKSITDSINYAKRIQTAMLPPHRLFKSIFPSSFVLYMPKDIVSGDFYWINKLGDKIFVSAVDCTGHGVPGAFMSIIGFELFRKITNIEGLSRPSDILNRLNEDFHVIFKDVDNIVLRDGMDVAFCSIDKKNMILEFAGAFNPLYLIRDNKITEIKGDRFAIGLDETNFKDQTFKNHLIPIQQGDLIYIFSDGFADQFGGPDGKKYKYRRFRHLLLNLHRLPMEKQHEILENNVLEWRGQQEQVDDILVIGIKIDF